MSKTKIHIEKMKTLLADLRARELEEKQPILEDLYKLYQEQPDETTALVYAKGLLNLTAFQEVSDCKKSVDSLSELSSRFPDDSAIALVYAIGLFNLTVDQDLLGCEQTVEKLGNLFSRFPEDSSIALEYAKGLFNLTSEQDLSGLEQTVKELANLSSQFSDDSAIVLVYAQGLFNLTVDQDLSGCKKTVEKLANLFSQFPADSSIALEYAQGLVNLSAKQDLLGREQNVEALASLFKRFSDDSAIALEYAKCLFNLSIYQDLSGRQASEKRLSTLFSHFPDNADIALVYAKILTNLGYKSEPSKCEAITGQLEELFKQFPKSIGIAEQTAWFQLIIGGKEEGEEVAKVAFAQALSYMNDRFPKKHHLLLERFLMIFSKDNEKKLCLLIETLLKPDFINLLNGIEATTIIKATDCYFYISENWENVREFLLTCKEQLSESKYAQWLDRIHKTENTDIEHLFKATKACKTILHLLRVNQKDLTHLSHYTALETLPKILLGKKDKVTGKIIRKNGKVEMAGRYRFYNANYMNDPEEGKLLHKWLEAEEENVDQVSPFYLMSLTTESDHLPMWVQYGRDGKGICVTLHDDLFEVKNSLAEHELIARATDLKLQECEEEADSQDEQKTSSSKEAERFAPYRICYMSDTNLYGNLFKPDELEKIKKELANLKDIFAASSQKKEIYQIMEEIRFLFKSADYVTENEVRLLKYADLKSDKILLDETGDGVPRLYVEQGGRVKIKKITFGPKVYNESKIVPYIKFCDPEIEIGVSGIHFR
ncbi:MULTISPECIES: hypothetical protein [Streptococcus]|uniref:hypothetical protein n=1 Tax=Streptococcus TaxID=1301 RepID=UPI0037CDF0A8